MTRASRIPNATHSKTTPPLVHEDGAYGLMAALTRAVEEGIPILEGAYLREMTEERLRHILRGEGPRTRSTSPKRAGL